MKNLAAKLLGLSVAAIALTLIIFLVPSGRKEITNVAALNSTSQQSTLDDLGESHLNKLTAVELQTKILDWDQYQQTSDYSIYADCGDSENNRLLKEMDSERRLLKLNNAYPLIVLPNLGHFDLAGVRSFLNDPTVTCGISQVVPLYAEPERILFGYRCLGGISPDRNSPSYRTDIACLQTGEAVADYFNLEYWE